MAKPRFHPPPALLAAVTFLPHTSRSLQLCVSGKSSTGGTQEMGTRAGRPQSSRPGQLIQRESTYTPRDWLGHARLVRANPGLLPERLRTGALLLLRLPGRQDISLEPWGHLSHPSTHLPGKPRSREAEPRHRERLMLTISSKAL